jgi:hypothetical protein
MQYDSRALQFKSSWRAPLPPQNIDERISSFVQQIANTFKQTHTMSNISAHQRDLLLQIKTNKNITILLSADKGLGHVGVDTKQYIEWGLHNINIGN